jgi:hypothetical protein
MKEKFCKVLQCQPGDILYWESDDADEEEDVSPVNKTVQEQTSDSLAKKDGSKQASRPSYKKDLGAA